MRLDLKHSKLVELTATTGDNGELDLSSWCPCSHLT